MQTEANAPLEKDYPCKRGPKLLNPLRVYPCELKLYSQQLYKQPLCCSAPGIVMYLLGTEWTTCMCEKGGGKCCSTPSVPLICIGQHNTDSHVICGVLRYISFSTHLIQIRAACALEEGLFLIWISHHDDLFFKASEDIFLFYPISSSH